MKDPNWAASEDLDRDGSKPDRDRFAWGERGFHDGSDDHEIERKWMQLARLDSEKFEFFYHKYRPRIFKYAFLNLKDHDLASDVTSETFSQASRNLGRFTWQGYSVGAWLFRIARNCMLMEMRRRKSRHETRYVPGFHDREDRSRPDQDLDRSEDTRLLMDALDRLTFVRREIFLQKYGLGLTTREIGVILDMPEATVKSHLQRGRAELLKILTGMGLERPLSGRGRQAVHKAMADDRGWDVLEGDPE